MAREIPDSDQPRKRKVEIDNGVPAVCKECRGALETTPDGEKRCAACGWAPE